MATQLYIGTERGLFTVVEGKRGWREAHGTLTGRRIVALDYDHSSPNYLFIAVDNEGIYTSNDAGDSAIIRVGGDAHSVFVRRDAPKIVYAGMDRALLYASGDGGTNWEKLDGIRELWGTPEELARVNRPAGVVRAAVASPNDRYSILAAIDPDGLARSTDNGHVWDFVPRAPTHIHSLAVSPADRTVIAAATDTGVSLSTDGGTTWTAQSDGLPAGIATWVSMTANDLYTVTGNTLYRANLHGGGWQPVPSAAQVGICAIAGDDNDARLGSGLFYGSAAGIVMRSRDNGQSWQEEITGLPPITCIAVTRD